MSMAICSRSKEINQSVGVRENSLGSFYIPTKENACQSHLFSSSLAPPPSPSLSPFLSPLVPSPPPFFFPHLCCCPHPLQPLEGSSFGFLMWTIDQLVYRNFPSIQHPIRAAEGFNTHELNSYQMLTDTVKLHSPYCVSQSNISLFMIHIRYLFFSSRDFSWQRLYTPTHWNSNANSGNIDYSKDPYPLLRGQFQNVCFRKAHLWLQMQGASQMQLQWFTLLADSQVYSPNATNLRKTERNALVRKGVRGVTKALSKTYRL